MRFEKKSILMTFFFTLVMTSSQYSHSESNIIGMSRYSDLNQDYFVVALHSGEEGKIDIHSDIYKRRIEIRVVSEKLFARQFARIWVNGSAINSNKMDLYQNTENIIEFTRCIKGNLQKGDIISIDYDPSLGTSLIVNGVFIHTFNESSFFNLLLGVLIGEVPLSSTMKRELLSDSPQKIPKKTRTLFDSLSPSNARIAEIKLWSKKGMVENLVEPGKKIATTNKPNQTANKTKKVVSITPPKEKQVATKAAIPTKSVKIEKKTLDIKAPDVKEDKYNPFTIESLLAERDFLRVVNDWVGSFSSFPVLVSDRPEKESIRFSITIDKEGNLLNVRQFDKSKHSALNKGAVKLIKKSVPYPKIPPEIQDDTVDLDLYFYLHWRYRR